MWIIFYLFCMEFFELFVCVDYGFSICLGRFQALFLQIFSVPFFSLLVVIWCVLGCLVVSHNSLKLCSFFFIVFSLCSSDYITSTELSYSLLKNFFPANSNQWLSPSNEIFVLIILLFNSRSSICFEKIIVSLLIIFDVTLSSHLPLHF